MEPFAQPIRAIEIEAAQPASDKIWTQPTMVVVGKLSHIVQQNSGGGAGNSGSDGS